MAYPRGSTARRGDRAYRARPARAVQLLVARLDPLTGGRALLVFSACAVIAATALLGASEREWAVASGTSAVLLGLRLLSEGVNWSRLPQPATAAFPIAVFATFAAFGVMAPHITSALGGLLTGAYLYTGLTHRPGSSAWVVPLGSATFAVMNGGLTHAVAVRMLVSAGVWITVVEILAAFTAEQQHLRRALTQAATHDVLTGVPNRRDLETRLTTLRPGDAVVLCDLDHFKQLNDTHGHHVGDRTLADFGALLRAKLRADDYCARYGGEEFLLVLPNTDLPTAHGVVQRLHAAWRLMEPGTTFSAGIAAGFAHRSPADTVAAADAALYQAKAAGRNTLRIEPPAEACPAR